MRRIAPCGMARIIGIGLIAAAMLPASGAVSDDSLVARLSRVLTAEEAHDGRASPYLLPVIEELAQAQLRDGGLAEARTLRRRALDIAVAAFGCDSPSAAEAMAALALVDIEDRRYLDAEPLLIIAEGLLADRVSADHPALVTILDGRAQIALARGDTGAAETLARSALALARRNPHLRTAEPLRTLGTVLTAEERFEEAEKLLDEALTQDRKQHGEGGLDTARSLAQLARLELRRGEPAAALPRIEQAISIDQSGLGPNHPLIADDWHDLGHVYAALNRRVTARAALTAAINVLEHGAGRETPRLGYAEIELSTLYRQTGDEAAAEAAFHDARRILNKAEAEEHRRERQI